MGTRCNIHFNAGKTVCANIYRHYDGYPGNVKNGVATEGGVLADLLEFYAELLANVNDRRCTDPTYLAAKFVVWQAKQNARTYTGMVDGKAKYEDNHFLDFLSLGICMEDAGDAEFIYELDCEKLDTKGCPAVRVREVPWGGVPKKRFRTVFLHGKPAKAAKPEQDNVIPLRTGATG